MGGLSVRLPAMVAVSTQLDNRNCPAAVAPTFAANARSARPPGPAAPRARGGRGPARVSTVAPGTPAGRARLVGRSVVSRRPTIASSGTRQAREVALERAQVPAGHHAEGARDMAGIGDQGGIAAPAVVPIDEPVPRSSRSSTAGDFAEPREEARARATRRRASAPPARNSWPASPASGSSAGFRPRGPRRAACVEDRRHRQRRPPSDRRRAPAMRRARRAVRRPPRPCRAATGRRPAASR